MWKIFLVFLLLIAQSQNGECITQWNKGAPASTDIKSIWPATSQANNSILDSLLQNYRRGLFLNYSSSTALGIGAGEVVVSNVTGTIRLFLVASTGGSITSANLDTGSITASTTYYVYAGTSTATDAAPTYYISLSATAPTSVTYYEQLGNFTTDSNSQFTGIFNNNVFNVIQSPISKSPGVVYQALTEGFFTVFASVEGAGQACYIYSDSSSSPGTLKGEVYTSSSTTSLNSLSIGAPVRKGDYYTASGNCGAGIWTPTSN